MRILITLIIAAVTATQAEEHFHSYSTIDGRQFSALLMSGHESEGELELLLEDGTCIAVEEEKLVEADKAYVAHRKMCDLFMSSSDFLIIPTRIVDRKKLIVDVSDKEALEAAEDFDRSEHALYLSLCNMGSIAVENMTIEYQIRYAHQRPAADGLALAEQDGENPPGLVTVSHIISGTVPLNEVAPGKHAVLSTDEVTLQDQQDTTSISGMWISVLMKDPDGKILERNISLEYGAETHSNI